MTEHTLRRRDPEARREELLHAAASIIEEEGTSYLTHRAVAARAGVALGTATKYFPSIDSLREEALNRLADQIDEEMDQLEGTLLLIDSETEKVARVMYDYLLDKHQVRADLTLSVAAAYEPDLREVSLRWTNRMIDILARRIGPARASILAVFFDGVTMHAAVNDFPIRLDHIVSTINAVLAMDIDDSADLAPDHDTSHDGGGQR